jgi:hypothetical protein
MLPAEVIHGGGGEGIQHAVAGAGADDEIIGKGDDAFQVEEKDVLSLFVFEGVYNFAGKFERVQGSPHGADAESCFALDRAAENNLV